MGVVDAAVARREVDLEHLLLLGRQVGGDQVLGASQQERPDPPAEALERLLVAFLLHRVGDQLLESRRVGVETRRHDREQRPQLHQPVLHRGAGQGEPEVGADPAYGLIGLRRVVLDRLRLVEHQPAPRLLGVRVDLEPEQGVGRDDDVSAVDDRQAIDSLRRDTDGRHGADDQPGREGFGLVRPRRHHAGRRHHQEWPGAGLARVRHQRQGLERLAEPHVVGQDAAEPALPEERQPAEAVELVGTQLGLDADQFDLRERLDVAQRLGRPDPLGRLLVDDADLGELFPEVEVAVADPDAVARLLVQLGGGLDQLGEVRELRAVDLDVQAVGHDHPRLSERQRLEHVRQRQELPVDLDRHLEVEPVGLGRARRRCRRAR